MTSSPPPERNAAGGYGEQDLFSAPKAEGSIDERFAAFDAANPEVYAEFRRIAAQLLNAGREHYSADAIMHVLRFERALRADRPAGELKLNDHYSSRMARKLMAADPRFEGFFETRTLKSRGGAA